MGMPCYFVSRGPFNLLNEQSRTLSWGKSSNEDGSCPSKLFPPNDRYCNLLNWLTWLAIWPLRLFDKRSKEVRCWKFESDDKIWLWKLFDERSKEERCWRFESDDGI